MLLLYIFELLPVYFHSSVFFLVFMFNWSTVYIHVSSHQHIRRQHEHGTSPTCTGRARGGLVLYFTFELPDRRRTTLFRLLIFFSPLNLITGRCVV